MEKLIDRIFKIDNIQKDMDVIICELKAIESKQLTLNELELLKKDVYNRVELSLKNNML